MSKTEVERFHPLQQEKWEIKFHELYLYCKKTGDCHIPHSDEENLSLSRWVKRQRYQYKRFCEGKPTRLDRQRVESLESIGFVWDPQRASWYRRFSELCKFRQDFGHCKVPSYYSNKQLVSWVKCQRRQRKLFLQGKRSCMTAERIDKLESIGFSWAVPSGQGSKRLNKYL